MATSSIITKTTDVLRSGREAEDRRTDYLCVLALVDRTAPRSIALPVRDALDPHMPTAEVRVVGADSGADLLAPTPPDLCVAVMGTNEVDMVAGICELAAAGVPVALMVESALDAPSLPLGATAASRVKVISATNEGVLRDRLAEWMVASTEKSIACAANFPFCRRAKTRELINTFAMENAMGTAKKGPGADLPSMTVNQARLALSIAAVNGQPLALGRIPEVLSAMAAGFGSRMFANKALGKIPVFGWMFQAGFGYLGTQATGRSLQHRFDKRERAAEEGKDISHPYVRKVVDAVSSARERAAARRAGQPVSSTGVAEVRLLPSSGEGGFLVYEEVAE